MNVLLDEIRIADDGSVDVRVIPLDPGDSRADIQENLAPGTPAWELTVNRYLRQISLKLGVEKVTAIVHAGADDYTCITSSQNFIEVGCRTRPELAEPIQSIADLMIATFESVQRNQLGVMASTSRPVFRRDTNALGDTPAPVIVRFKTCALDEVPLPGQLNPRPQSKRDDEAHYETPNRLARTG